MVLINCFQHLNQDQFTEANRYIEVLNSLFQGGKRKPMLVSVDPTFRFSRRI